MIPFTKMAHKVGGKHSTSQNPTTKYHLHDPCPADTQQNTHTHTPRQTKKYATEGAFSNKNGNCPATRAFLKRGKRTVPGSFPRVRIFTAQLASRTRIKQIIITDKQRYSSFSRQRERQCGGQPRERMAPQTTAHLGPTVAYL